MFSIKVLIIFSVYLVVLVEANPCKNANGKEIDICVDGIVEEDKQKHNVIIKAGLMKNCTCNLSIKDKTGALDAFIGRHGNYTVSDPGTIGGCGLVINFVSNTNTFYVANCMMGSIKNRLTGDQKVIIMSQTQENGVLQKGSGYCIEIINEKVTDEGGALYLQCGLQTELSILPTETTTESDSSSLNGSKSTLSTQMLKVHSNSSAVAIAIGASAGSVVLLLLIAITIFAVLKNRRCQTSERATSEEQNVNEIKACEDDSEYGLQYNSLYNMGFQPEPNNCTTAQCKDEPSVKTKTTKTNKSVEVNDGASQEDNDGYHTIDSAMEIPANQKPIDKDGTYSTIEDYVNHKESQLDESDMVRQQGFPEVDGRHLHKYRADCTEDKSNIDVYAVPDKRKVKHVITPSGCEYAMVNK